MKNNILVLGAGRSAFFLIKLLSGFAEKTDISITIADIDGEQLNKLQLQFKNIKIKISSPENIETLIKYNDIIVSLLPPAQHISIIKICIAHNKNFINASYLTSEIKSLEPEIKKRNLTFLTECGLDPGIDHITSIMMLNNIKEKGGEILEYKSYCGGLMSNESDNNPWKYKITWNPQNVVLAGQGGLSSYLEDGKIKYLSYQRLFTDLEVVKLKNGDVFEAFKNRDSLKYISIYNLDNIQSFARSTLRKIDYCQSWNILVQLGLTDNQTEILIPNKTTYFDFFNQFLQKNHQFGFHYASKHWEKVEWLFSFYETIPYTKATPAQVLQLLLEKRWKLEPQDRDRVVMKHIIKYKLKGEIKFEVFELDIEGTNNQETAMAKTVGTPLFAAVQIMMNNQNLPSGIFIPSDAYFYNPLWEIIKKELELNS